MMRPESEFIMNMVKFALLVIPASSLGSAIGAGFGVIQSVSMALATVGVSLILLALKKMFS
jgi:energy-converting hydrogenase Eha subunit E